MLVHSNIYLMYTRAHACDVCANTWIIPSTVSTSERSWVKLFDIRDLRQSACVLFCHKLLRVGLKTTLQGRCCFLFRALRFYGMSVECFAYIDSTKKERLLFFLLHFFIIIFLILNWSTFFDGINCFKCGLPGSV